MPNTCSNWIRVSNCPTTIEFLAKQPLQLDMIDKPPPGLFEPPYSDWADEWIEKYWGTKWINGHTHEECDILWKREDDGSLTTRFFSAWSPPLAFYNNIIETYPQLRLEYEYTIWEMGYAGHGVGGSGSDRCYYQYQSKEEMDELKRLRDWHLNIWNPHFASPSSLD
jgi:hypothetical protein